MGAKYFADMLIIILLLYSTRLSNALEQFNQTDDENYIQIVNKHGDVMYMKESLSRKLEEESHKWHWKPWIPTRTTVLEKFVVEVECLMGDSINNFPGSIFTDEQLRKGAFLLYVIFGIYSFTLLAIVCNSYFIPCVEYICEDLKIPPNVGAATFMSVATSCPEFFVNVISTFLTESDMGIGTIVGSALFNALGVAAIGSIAAIVPIKIDSRPVTRDVIIYVVNVSVLVAIVWDGVIHWYEALVLEILYVLYFVLMFNSPKIFTLIDRVMPLFCNKETSSNSDVTVTIENGKTHDDDSIGIDNQAYNDDNQNHIDPPPILVDGIKVNDKEEIVNDKENDEEDVISESFFIFPKDKSMGCKIWWVYTFPIKIILGITIPSPVTCRRIYPLAFLMCIIWIAVNSYMVSWSMTVIGHTFFIPESIMGMTFLALGGCLPEACSIFIMSRRGEGAMGVSNALGANSLAILFALGLPWLIRTLSLLVQGYDAVVLINSSGIEFVVASLIVAVFCLWLALYFGKFIMRKGLGAVLFTLYVCFIIVAILIEMGIIFDRGIKLC